MCVPPNLKFSFLFYVNCCAFLQINIALLIVISGLINSYCIIMRF